MTVCIAALYEKGEGAVLVSDKMVTAHFPIGYEFEHQKNTKIIPIDDDETIYIMIAGDILFGNEIVNDAKLQIALNNFDVSGLKASQIIRESYQKLRLIKIVQHELEPRGLDLNAFYAGQHQLSPQIVQMIDKSMSNTDMNVEMLVVGPNDKNHSIYTIGNPGVIRENDAIGYSAIGSGAPHAIYSLIENSYNSEMDMEKVEELAMQAKIRSQVAPGVGIETTTIVIPKTNEENETKKP